jgi:putative sigma-54 modulation protein
MKLKISYKHMKHSDALDERIKDKSDRLEKYYEGNLSVQWVCWVHEEKHWAEVKVHGPKFDYFAKGWADNMYKTLDLVIDKIERQIDKQKGMHKNRMHHAPYETPKYKEIQKQINEEEKLYMEEWEDKTA